VVMKCEDCGTEMVEDFSVDDYGNYWNMLRCPKCRYRYTHYKKKKQKTERNEGDRPRELYQTSKTD